MSIINKLMFWKKEAPKDQEMTDLPLMPELGKMPDMEPQKEIRPPITAFPEPELDTQQDFPPTRNFQRFEEPKPMFGMQAQQAQQAQQMQPTQTNDRLETISAKIDTLKAQLDSVLQRLERIEQNNKEERLYRQRWQ